ncbi:hypothetical protein JAAARDRAFT_118069, partial [Jaapia argillacea MUCL 33604]
MGRFKIKNVTGQVANTRARSVLGRVQDKVDAVVVQYNHARQGYLSLNGPGPWENTLQVLYPTDVRGPNEKDIKETEALEAERLAEQTGVRTGVGTSGRQRTHRPGGGTVEVEEGRRMLSWLWMQIAADESSDDPKMREVLCIEWAKAKARAERWCKEVTLLDEEMCRAIVYCEWKATWWMSQKTRREDLSEDLAEGLCAYTSEQAISER